MQPTLYLLAPGQDVDPIFCPESAMVEGILHYYPSILDAVVVKRIAFARPRPDLVAALGEAYQGAPVLVFADDVEAPASCESTPEGRRFLAGPDAIATFFADAGLAGRRAP
ncbi:DUF3088 family protein [Sphingopyxis sp. DHUNG17]|uniref:DUF3088 family protein n=1 Tax=Sphingopyxis jiangsuensis TaxID=2871171 RepID=UPI00191E4871|nr:DUF3088 family protein [Sphingopyxis lutea]